MIWSDNYSLFDVQTWNIIPQIMVPWYVEYFEPKEIEKISEASSFFLQIVFLPRVGHSN